MGARVLVTGGGASGLMAALFAARQGARVTLLERNEKLGKKLYITGKGRCNITNNARGEEFMRSIPRNPRFVYASLACLSNEELMRLMESLGLPLVIERGERVFPESQRASDVTRALEAELKRLGVNVVLNARVSQILASNGRASGVRLEDGREYLADAVILATGGLSYPTTGSTGDGYAFAERLGHTLTPMRPALTSLETEETWPEKLMGLTLKNVCLRAISEAGGKRKRLYSKQGELLLTHFGVSGPLALTLSSLLPDEPRGIKLEIDLKPALDEKTLDARVTRDFQAMSRRQLFTVMDGLAPHSLGMQILELADAPAYQPVNSVTAQTRKRIVALIKALPLTVKGYRGMNEAVITRGGVNVKEVNPSTLESKLVPGLYFAGELLDVDALTGGFNLQIAFSTGALAGKSAATRNQSPVSE